MTDHGHDLLFGSFLTPAASTPQRGVDLAVLSEQVGLDLATFQDHPYQPALLDTWTVLAVTAARTSRIRLAANVTNLPLRPPAVLARSVAALDLLSGGRIELGLGAGGFRDAVVAMGGPSRTGGQAVDALAEAIAVVRQVWDTGTGAPVQVDGEHYRVLGARRGPAPAHPVSIWIGSYKPRMLELTGRLGDGWLPSAAYLEPGGLTAGNAIVDRAAREAGRDPADVRRLLNISGRFATSSEGPLHGPADQWAEELTDLALTEGVSAFILATDDPDDLRRYAADVVPAVREAVAAERADRRRPPPPTPRPAPSALAVVATPPPATRRSTEVLWDETTRPTGPPPDPDRRYTTGERAAAQHLVDVHDDLRRDLAQLLLVVDQVADGTASAQAARGALNSLAVTRSGQDVGGFCRAYCRVVATHHGLEDAVVFPQLRHTDRRLTAVLHRLDEEHQVVHAILDRVDQALVAFLADPGTTSSTTRDPAADLRDAVDVLGDALLSHLAYEERELIEPLARSAR